MAKHQISFTVTLTYEGKVPPEQELPVVAMNILDALQHQAEASSAGLFGEDGEAYTTAIQVIRPSDGAMVGVSLGPGVEDGNL